MTNPSSLPSLYCIQQYPILLWLFVRLLHFSHDLSNWYPRFVSSTTFKNFPVFYMCCVQTIDVMWTWLQIEFRAIFLSQQKELWVPLCSLSVFCSFQNNSCVLHSEAHSNLAFRRFASLICHILKLIWPYYWLVVCVYAYICSWNIRFFPEGRGSSTLQADGCYCPKQSRIAAWLSVIILFMNHDSASLKEDYSELLAVCNASEI